MKKNEVGLSEILKDDIQIVFFFFFLQEAAKQTDLPFSGSLPKRTHQPKCSKDIAKNWKLSLGLLGGCAAISPADSYSAQ